MLVTSGRYFSEKELACSHCGVSAMDADFIKQIDLLRSHFGPMVITSGYRCKDHEIEKAKKRGPGAHTTGKAIDVAVDRGDAYRFLGLVFQWHSPYEGEPSWDFTGIGINQKGKQRFIHIDTVTEGVRPTVWSY